MNQGKIFVISGPSGVRKETIVEVLLKNPALNFYWAKSYTTRPPRESDKSENHYIFIDENKFHELEKEDEIIESNIITARGTAHLNQKLIGHYKMAKMF